MTNSIWPESEQTKELLDAAKGGDEKAVGDLFQRHRDSLRRLVAMRIDQKILRRVDVSDVVQEVLVEANRRLQDYLENPVLSFHLWIRQIAKDRIIDAHRRHRGSAKRSIDREQAIAPAVPVDQSTVDLMAQLCDAEMTPAAVATQQEMAQQLRLAIEKLEERDQEIIYMRHFEQLSNQEAAQALGLTEPATSMRYLRALKRLRSALDVSPQT